MTKALVHVNIKTLLAALLASSFVAPARASAQAGLGHLDDASMPPAGLFRLRAITAFYRSEGLFSDTGVVSLGAPLTGDSLGAAQIPELAAIQSAIAGASGSAFSLSLGQSRYGATARTEIVPVGVEYGVTDRFAVGVVVPFVRKRMQAQFVLDTLGANVGPNPVARSNSARQTNVQVQAEFANAQSLLQGRMQFCQANPGAAGCAEVLSQGPQLLQASQDFAATLFALYGGAGADGFPFVPRSQSTAQTAIATQVSLFNQQYQQLLNTTENLIQAVPAGAPGPAGFADVHGFLVSEAGRDSLLEQERNGIGDVEVGFRLRVLDGPRADRGTGIGLAVASFLRLPTGSRQSPSGVADLRLGDGSYVIDSRAVMEARAGHVGLLAAAHVAVAVSSRDTGSSSPGDKRWMELTVAPRLHLSEPFSIHGAFSRRSSDRSGADRLVGGGVSFSTLSAYRRDGRVLPMEMRFTHLEAIGGDPGRPKFFRDQIEVRIYFHLRGIFSD
jgi:hypothetical protein